MRRVRSAAISVVPPCGRQAGFLVVEALATFAISALILAGLASLLGVMLRAADRAADRVQDLETTARAVAALRRDIQLLARARWSGAAPRSFVFAGEPEKIMFAQSVPQGSGFRTATVVVIQSVGIDAGGRLLRTEAALTPGAASLRELHFSPARNLQEGRSTVRFAYFARAREGGSEVLVDHWPSAVQLPAAVRIGIVDPATGGLLSSVRVPIRVDAEAGCAAPDIAFCSRADPKKSEDKAPSDPPSRGTGPRRR